MNKYLIFFTLFVGLLAGILFFLFYSIAQFPSPTGHYGVGYKTYHWVDTSRKELNAQDPQHPNRELMVYCFYPSSLRYDGTGPTEKNDKSTPVAYDPDAAKSAMKYFASCSKLPAWLFSSVKLIKTHIQVNAPLAKSTTTFPIIIFLHGGNGPIVQSYTWMLEELASQGFVVIGIDNAKDRAREAQGKAQQVETYAQKVSFVINKMEQLFVQKDAFWSNVNLDKIGVLGHSLGGRTAVRAMRKDKRIKCGINMDGGIQEDDANNPFSAPFMFMVAEKGVLCKKDLPGLEAISRLVNASGTNMKMMTIKNVGHSIFSDAPLQLNMTLFGRLISNYADFKLEVPANRASEILVNKVMPTITKFFLIILSHKNLKMQ